MYRLSLIISEIYNKYLPLAEKGNIRLNLDFSDTTKTIDDPETIKADLEKHLSSALSRSDRGEISIAVEEDAMIITDSGTILSKPICALLSKGRVNVSSRVGFGTNVRISLLPSSPESSPEPALPAPAPAPKTSKKTLASRAKPTREQRKLVAAAKKADRKIQKLANRSKNQTTKQKSSTKQNLTKKTKKTRKKVIELS